MEDTEFITTRELAKMLRVTENAIARDRVSGGGNYPPFIKFKKSVRYRLSTVLNWIEQRERIPKSAA